jgi:ABC-2 type transport system permease protein
MNNGFASIKKFFNRKQFKYGGYAILVTLIGIAVIVLINVGLTALESNFDLKIDMTQNKKYSISDQTKKIVGDLTKDIYIYTTYVAGSEDKDVSSIITKFKGLSSRIHVENKDPDLNPSFANKFKTDTSTSIASGSVIVTDKDGKLFRVLDQSSLYQYTYNSTSGSYEITQIKAEGAITTAINFIEIGYIPTAYVVQGHGELTTSNLGDINTKLSENNINLETWNIAQEPTKVKAGDIIIFFNPSKDISEDERATLKPLMEKGGRFLFLFDPLTTDTKTMPNLMSLLALYDISLKSGVVVETSGTNLYSTQYPTVLIPDIQTHTITTPLASSNLPVIIPQSGAILLPDSAPETSMKITSLLKSSSKSYLKSVTDAQSDLTKTSTDETGPFDLAAAVEKTVGSAATDSVKFVVVYNTQWATTSQLTTNYSNIDLLLNSAKWLRDADKDIYVRAKSTSAATLNFKNAVQAWTVIIISVLLVPILMLVAGIVVYLKRKHL